MSNEVLVVLREALNKEEDRKAFYEDASQRACNPLAQRTFAKLATQEAEHATYIRRYYQAMESGAGWPAPSECGEVCQIEADEVKGIFTNAREDIAGDVTCETSLMDAYKIAMQGERDAIDFYKAQLATAADDNARAFYTVLVEAERTHLQLLASTEAYLSDPEGWFFEEENWIVEG